MFGHPLEHARRVRHVLDAWCVLALCPLLGFVPWIGLPLGILLGLAGICAGMQLIRDIRVRLGVLFLMLFSGWLLAFPVVWISTRSSGAHSSSRPLKPSAPSVHVPVTPPSVAPPPPASQPHEQAAEIAVREAPKIQPQDDAKPESVPDETRPAPPVTQSSSSLSTDSLPNTAAEDLSFQAKKTVDNWWLAKSMGRIEDAAQLHTDPTMINGSELSGVSLQRYLMADWKRNALVKEAPVLEPIVTRRGDQWQVECLMRFGMPLKGKSYLRRGQCLHTFFLTGSSGFLRIREHQETVKPTPPPSPSSVGGMKVSSLLSIASDCIEADLVGDLDASMSSYGPVVVYFGKTLTSAQISADKRNYFERWPIRYENFFGAFSVELLPGKKVGASFQGRFRTESRERGEWCAGLIEHHFVFELSGGRPVIVQQSGSILESRKGQF